MKEQELLNRPEIKSLCRKTGVRPAVAWARLKLFKKGLRTSEQLNAKSN